MINYGQYDMFPQLATFVEAYLLPEADSKLRTAVNEPSERQQVLTTINLLQKGDFCFGAAFDWLLRRRLQFRFTGLRRGTDNLDRLTTVLEMLEGLNPYGMIMDYDERAQKSQPRRLNLTEQLELKRFLYLILGNQVSCAALFHNNQLGVAASFADTTHRRTPQLYEKRITAFGTKTQHSKVLRLILRSLRRDTMMLILSKTHTIALYCRRTRRGYVLYLFDPIGKQKKIFCDHRFQLTQPVVRFLYRQFSYANDQQLLTYQVFDFKPRLKNDINVTSILQKAQIAPQDTFLPAMHSGSVESIEYCLKNGADPSLVNDKQESALFFAASINSLSLIKTLLTTPAAQLLNNSILVRQLFAEVIANASLAMIEAILSCKECEINPQAFENCAIEALFCASLLPTTHYPDFFTEVLEMVTKKQPNKIFNILCRVVYNVVHYLPDGIGIKFPEYRLFTTTYKGQIEKLMRILCDNSKAQDSGREISYLLGLIGGEIYNGVCSPRHVFILQQAGQYFPVELQRTLSSILENSLSPPTPSLLQLLQCTNSLDFLLCDEAIEIMYALITIQPDFFTGFYETTNLGEIYKKLIDVIVKNHNTPNTILEKINRNLKHNPQDNTQLATLLDRKIACLALQKRTPSGVCHPIGKKLQAEKENLRSRSRYRY